MASMSHLFLGETNVSALGEYLLKEGWWVSSPCGEEAGDICSWHLCHTKASKHPAVQGRVGALEKACGQALSPGLIRIDKGWVSVRRQLKLMAGSSQGGAWAIKICSNTALIMSVITDPAITKSPKCCVCSTGQSWRSWGTRCVWVLAFVQEEACSEELEWEERVAQDSWAPLQSSYTSLCLSLEKNVWVVKSSPRMLDFRCVLRALFTIWVCLPQTSVQQPSSVQEPIPVLPWGELPARQLRYSRGCCTSQPRAGALPELPWSTGWGVGIVLVQVVACALMAAVTRWSHSHTDMLKSKRALGWGWRA